MKKIDKNNNNNIWIKNSNEIKKIIEDYMKEMGIYDPSFIISISILAKLFSDYALIRKDWEEEGCPLTQEHTNKMGKTNTVKDPLYQAMEKLRMDILTYLKELGLTPNGLKKIKQNSFETVEKSSKIDKLLEVLG